MNHELIAEKFKKEVDARLRMMFNAISEGVQYTEFERARLSGFMQAGVFLGYRDGPGREDFEEVCERRTTGGLLPGWFHEWTVSGDWTLAFSWLAPWAHWITPKLRRQRYDTRFFLAFMPDGQTCTPDARETTEGIWIGPKEGLEGNLQGKIPLSPPTLVTLHELLPYANVEDLKRELEKRPWGEARLPRFLRLERDGLILQPWDPMIHEDVQIDVDALPSALVPVGEAFSRLWLHKGLWRPVRC